MYRCVSPQRSHNGCAHLIDFNCIESTVVCHTAVSLVVMPIFPKRWVLTRASYKLFLSSSWPNYNLKNIISKSEKQVFLWEKFQDSSLIYLTQKPIFFMHDWASLRHGFLSLANLVSWTSTPSLLIVQTFQDCLFIAFVRWLNAKTLFIASIHEFYCMIGFCLW